MELQEQLFVEQRQGVVAVSVHSGQVSTAFSPANISHFAVQIVIITSKNILQNHRMRLTLTRMVGGFVHGRQERCCTQGWRSLFCPGCGELLFAGRFFVQIFLKCIRLVRQPHTDVEDTDEKEIGDWRHRFPNTRGSGKLSGNCRFAGWNIN